MEEYLNEQEQWERVLQWVREQGPWVVVTVAVVAAGYWGFNAWQRQVERRDESASARYGQIVDDFGRNNIDGGLKLADELVKDFPATAYADQANLAAARIQVEHGNLDQAAARLAQVMNSSKDQQLALIARLRLARVQLALNKPDDALNTLNGADPGAFAARFAQVRGDILVAKGDRAGALREYQNARKSAGETLDVGLLDLKIDELARS